VLRSKDIAHYFSIPLNTLKPGKAITFDLHLYFQQNQHIMIWQRNGEVPTGDFISRYEAKGIHDVWIHQDDRGAYEEYLKDEPAVDALEPEALPDLELTPEPAAEVPAISDHAQYLIGVYRDHDQSDRNKTALMAKRAREVIAGTLAPQTSEAQAITTREMRKTVQDFLADVLKQEEGNLRELWDMADLDPGLSHAANVASYCVLLTLAVGQTEPATLKDMAQAGLLHDLGVTQVSAAIVANPWSAHTSEQHRDYREHVMASVDLAQEYGAGVTEHAARLMMTHHEKFDGTGYPSQMHGFQLTTLAQIVAMAEWLDSIACGQWDGRARTYAETIETLEDFEKDPNFPQYFHPKLFRTLMTWLKSPGSTEEAFIRMAVNAVDAQSESILKKSA